jgi:hypothetical protein
MGISGTLSPGDIAAVSGHVVIIDSVGSDPFGLARAKNISQCSTLNSDGFNFVIIQSSPSKNGIGINKYMAADYLVDEVGTIKSGFETYAQEACKAKFQKKDILMKATGFQMVRHLQTSSCMDRPISLVGQDCALKCQSLVSSARLDSSQMHKE